MGAVERSYATVESHLESLGQVYSSFSVNQTTLAVSSDRYEREVAAVADATIDVYAKVENGQSEILHLEEGNSPELPSTTVTSVTDIEDAARRAVEATVDTGCRVRGLDSATILGVRDADDESRETVYSLAVVVDATVTDESVTVDGHWRDGVERERLFA